MNRLHEELGQSMAIVPQSIAASGNAISSYLAAQDVLEMDFRVLLGAVAASKTATVEVYGATAAAGTGATKIGTIEIAGGDAGIASAQVVVSINPVKEYSHYAVKVVNGSAVAAVLAAAVLLTRPRYYPVDGQTVIVV